MQPQSAIRSLQSKIYCLSPSQVVTLIILTLFLLCLYGWNHYSHNQQPAKSLQLAPKYVFVQVSGKVRSPGIYCFDQPVTVSQAVARAGGLLHPLEPADQLEWERKQTSNSSRIHIMANPNGIAHLRLGWMSVPTSLALGVPLNVNQASAAELAQVPGINAKLAERIVTFRRNTGAFSKLDDIRGVKGIGPATVNRLRPYLKVGEEG